MTSSHPHIDKVAQVLATRAGEGPQKKGESWFWREESRRKWIGIATAAHRLFQVDHLADLAKLLRAANARISELEGALALMTGIKAEGQSE